MIGQGSLCQLIELAGGDIGFELTIPPGPLMTRTTDATNETLLLALDLGNRTWKLGFTVGGGALPPRIRTIAARDLDALLREISAAKTRFGLKPDAPLLRVAFRRGGVHGRERTVRSEGAARHRENRQVGGLPPCPRTSGHTQVISGPRRHLVSPCDG